MNVFLATSNAHKIEELSAILAPAGWTLRTGRDLPDPPEPEETGATYEENAVLKARAWARAAGAPALAAASGLEIEALGGAPGLRSARYAPTSAERIAKALRALEGVGAERRGARFVCCAALAWPAARPAPARARLAAAWSASPAALRGEEGGLRWLWRRGECPGRIAFAPSGAGGFGYDPIFLVADRPGQTMAELSAEDKNRLSHRARALSAILAALDGAA